MREVDRAVQGLMRVKKEHINKDEKKICRLWMHEIARVFQDRLTSEEDKVALYKEVAL
jgi:predicted transcriptional regulator